MKVLYHPLIAPDGQEFDDEHAESIMARGDHNGGWLDKKPNQSGIPDTQEVSNVHEKVSGAMTADTLPDKNQNSDAIKRATDTGDSKTANKKGGNPKGG